MALKSTVHVEGMGELLRTLGRIDAGMSKGLKAELRGIGKTVQARVRAGKGDPFRTGKLRRSIKVSVRTGGITRVGGVTLYSSLPQAGVWEWGGTIQPRGAPIQIPKTQFVRGEVFEAAEDTEGHLAALFDTLARGGGVLAL